MIGHSIFSLTSCTLIASKASLYQAEGNLQEAAKLLVHVNAETNSDPAVRVKLAQLRLERNQTEADRFLQPRQARLQFASPMDKGIKQVGLAWVQRVSGDIAQSKVSAEQARNTLQQISKEQPDNAFVAAALAVAYALLDEKGSALNEAQRAIALVPSSKDRLSGPGFEENLALVEMLIGENSRAIATLTQLLQTPYSGWLYTPAPITPALLRLDSIWDPLRADPTFQKLCEERHPAGNQWGQVSTFCTRSQQNAREAAGIPVRGVSAPASDIRKGVGNLLFVSERR